MIRAGTKGNVGGPPLRRLVAVDAAARHINSLLSSILEYSVTQSTELAIRLRRATFNRALAQCDLNAIGPLLAQDAILVTGSDSAVISGRKAQLLAWKREFAAPDRTIYTRTPTSILPSPVEPIALEQGEWAGVSAGMASPVASGAYSAKWRKIGADWVIEAEIFVTLG
jgi:ketosteroid isomerase-like protein